MPDPRAIEIIRKVKPLWAPPPRLSLSEWSDEYRRTSSEASAEVGKWRTRPYQKEPLDAFTDPTVHCIVIESAIQMLKTELILNALGYVIHLDPGPVMVVQFRDTDCETFSKIRLAPMLRDSPVLRGLVSDAKSKSSGNTITHKTFPGGHLRIVASSSPGNLSALPIRYFFGDEVDKWPASAGPEGDPLTLAEGRMEEFDGISKEILACSPTVAGESRIDAAYQESDRRVYEVPCPHCGGLQILKWEQVKWDSAQPTLEKQAKTARYVCEHCRSEWDDGDRWKAVNQGRYRATAPFHGIAGFRISALNSLKKRLSKYVLQFLKAQGNTERLKAFVNTVLAETWVEKGEAPEYRLLIERREKYPQGTVPMGGLILTAGVDIQRDRIEVEIMASGRNRETWSVDYRILEGRTSEPAVWSKLTEIVNELFPHESGAYLPISRMFVDSGDGTMTNDVYAWVRSQPEGRVVAIKGDDRALDRGAPVSQPSPVDALIGGKKYGLKIKRIAVSFFKSELYSRLKLRPPTPQERERGIAFPPGYCHFPEGVHYEDEHFKQLTAEQLVSRKLKNGRTKLEWRKDGRNEALDCRNYARAAAWDCGVDQYQGQESYWKTLESRMVVGRNSTAQRQNQAGRQPRFRMET